MMRDYLHPVARGRLLRCAIRDNYVLKNKTSRDDPRKKEADAPPGPPEIKTATAARIRKARELRSAA